MTLIVDFFEQNRRWRVPFVWRSVSRCLAQERIEHVYKDCHRVLQVLWINSTVRHLFLPIVALLLRREVENSQLIPKASAPQLCSPSDPGVFTTPVFILMTPESPYGRLCALLHPKSGKKRQTITRTSNNSKPSTEGRLPIVQRGRIKPESNPSVMRTRSRHSRDEELIDQSPESRTGAGGRLVNV